LTGAGTHRQLATSLRRAILPQEILGRANATFDGAVGVLLALGGLIAGPLGTAAGVRSPLWISAVIGLAALLILQLSAVRRVRSLSTPDVTR
jgi:MFS family permease